MAVTDTTRVLRFGVAGLGVAATEILPNIAGNPHLIVAGGADPRPEARDRIKQEYEADAFETVEAMCESPNIDAIYVCTPNFLHREHVITAARNGKHVIVEKPMALSIAECEEMNEAVERCGVKLLCGHTHSFDPPIRQLRQIIESEQFGKLCMINTWHYQDFMYRTRMPQELDSSKGGNVVFNQGPHAFDIVRLLGGGMVRSVRAMTGVWDPARRAEGAWAAYLEFEDGTPAINVFNGYAHFDTAEFTWWKGESPSDPDKNHRTRRVIAELESPEQEWANKSEKRYGGATMEYRGARPDSGHPIFGITIVSCEHADIRQSLHGLLVYGDEQNWEIPVTEWLHGRQAELEELYQAVAQDRPVYHDGRWGEATLEVVLAIIQSAKERRDIILSHQVPSPE